MFDAEYSGGDLRWFNGKRLVSDIRGGDYAHAGEEEAIEKVFARFPKDKNRKILDVGGGCGGTANFLQKNGWGRVVGVDIEAESINYSKDKYPEAEFYVCDACDGEMVKNLFKETKFDVITLIHSLCVFPKQLETISALRSLAHQNTILAIFEYEDFTGGNNPLNRHGDAKKYFNIISRSGFKSMLKDAGWELKEEDIFDITGDFLTWYNVFLQQLKVKRELLIVKHGNEYYDKAEKRYGSMVDAIKQGTLGGCILYASPSL